MMNQSNHSGASLPMTPTWPALLAGLACVLLLTASGAAAAQSSAPQDMQAPAPLSAPAHPDPYVPPALRQPAPDAGSGPVMLRFQAMQKLKKRFEEADADGSGTLTREEAHKAGLGFIEKNFDHIDTAQRGTISFDDLKAFLIQRREEARTR